MLGLLHVSLPQWSPALSTGKSSRGAPASGSRQDAAMEPGAEHREEGRVVAEVGRGLDAAMEPGAEHREEAFTVSVYAGEDDPPQWSPALSTGKSVRFPGEPGGGLVAAMEPGAEHREERSWPSGWPCHRSRRNGARR